MESPGRGEPYRVGLGLMGLGLLAIAVAVALGPGGPEAFPSISRLRLALDADGEAASDGRIRPGRLPPVDRGFVRASMEPPANSSPAVEAPIEGSVSGLPPPPAPFPVPDGPLADPIEVQLELAPPSELAPRLDLRIEEQDIRRALELLGTEASVNILISPGVDGIVSLDLTNVTFEEALEVLLKLGNLRVRRDGEILYVYSAEEYEAIVSAEREPAVRVFHLNYVRAADVALMIQPFLSEVGSFSLTPPSQQGLGGATAAALSGGGLPGVGTGLSSGATVAAGAPVSAGSDTGGNSLAIGDALVVRDYPENLDAIAQILGRLDVQPLQVLIEAVILSVELTDDQQLGVNFALVDNLATAAAVSGSGALINAAAGFTPARVLSTTAPPAGYLDPRPGQLIPGYLGDPTLAHGGLKFGFVSENVSGFVRALEVFNKVDVLASPRVLVLNKQRAEIQLGRRLGYRNTVTNLTSSLETVQFLSVGTLLTLRPYVSADGMIRLEIHPERSSGVLDAQGIPQTNTSELTTNILVPDGATIVIGGLIDSVDSLAEDGILGLSRIPLLGPLFRSRRTQVDKRELIVLLTPRILNRGGLPAPWPGVAPIGPAGIPNSGPMPGPPLPPLPHPGESILLGRLSLEEYASRHRREFGEILAATDRPPAGPAPAGEDSPEPASRNAPRDGHVGSTSLRSPAPLPARAEARPAAPATRHGAASPRRAASTGDDYRPGDYTRRLVESLERRPGRREPRAQGRADRPR